ncbi:hypothetical protein [Streptomyces sp. NPDC050416]|uniref:hypothetical protein n=1 Tax=Streptomyces sp. NPDC050416 TaxID=3365611 RepID=UPI00379984B4
MSALVHRPTEYAAVMGSKARPLPPASRVVDLLIVARATDDRYGARLFSALLDRILGTESK